jgi:hypothetical protein
MQASSLKALAVVTSIFFFTSSLSGSFLTIYFKESGLTVPEIATLLLFTFVVIGFIPAILLRSVRDFERIMIVGIFTTMLFYIIAIFTKDPVVLGLSYGLSIATFWPSFNLLQFRLSEVKIRARTVSLFSAIIPSVASIVGPMTASLIIESFDFAALFMTAVGLYLVAFVLCIRMRFQPESQRLSLPKTPTFAIFFLTFIVLGFSETYWVANPFLFFAISETILNMGFVMTSSAILVTAIYLLVNWLSDIAGNRVIFTIIGTALNFIWYLAIPFSSTTYHIVALSLLSGFAGAFTLSWFAHYADCFGKEQHASILVLMEIGLMIGRILNLVPTVLFIPNGEYVSYYWLSGIVLLLLIPSCIASTRGRNTSQLQALSPSTQQLRSQS